MLCCCVELPPPLDFLLFVNWSDRLVCFSGLISTPLVVIASPGMYVLQPFGMTGSNQAEERPSKNISSTAIYYPFLSSVSLSCTQILMLRVKRSYRELCNACVCVCVRACVRVCVWLLHNLHVLDCDCVHCLYACARMNAWTSQLQKSECVGCIR